MIRKFDIFGTHPKFYYTGKGIYQTYFGSFLTFLLFGTAVLACIYYGKEIYQKENPQTIFTDEYIQSPEKYILTKDSKTIALGLQDFADPNINYIDESIYKVHFVNTQMRNVFNEQTQQLELQVEVNEVPTRKCTIDDFIIPETENYFHELPFIDYLYCIDYDQAQSEISMEGDFGQPIYSTMDFFFKQCIPSETQQCQDQKDIDAKLQSSYMAMYYSDKIIQPKNFTDPFLNIGRDAFTSVTNLQKKALYFYWRNVYFESNDGYIWDHIVKENQIVYSKDKEQIFSSPDEDGTFMHIEMSFEKVKQTRVYRNYLNIATVLAQVGGILKIVFLFFWFISYLFCNRDYDIDILNKLFNFQYLEENEIQNQKNKESKKREKPEQKNSLSNQAYLKELLNDMKGKLTVKSFKTLFDFCLKKNEKTQKQLFKIAQKQLVQKLDIVRIIKKLDEVDKIKELLLTHDQQTIFKQIAKPIIKESEINEISSVNNKNIQQSEGNFYQQSQANLTKEQLYELEQQKAIISITESFEAYKRIKKKKTKNVVDLKVIQLMDSHVLDVFEHQYELTQEKFAASPFASPGLESSKKILNKNCQKFKKFSKQLTNIDQIQNNFDEQSEEQQESNEQEKQQIYQVEQSQGQNLTLENALFQQNRSNFVEESMVQGKKDLEDVKKYKNMISTSNRMYNTNISYSNQQDDTIIQDKSQNDSKVVLKSNFYENTNNNTIKQSQNNSNDDNNNNSNIENNGIGSGLGSQVVILKINEQQLQEQILEDGGYNNYKKNDQNINNSNLNKNKNKRSQISKYYNNSISSVQQLQGDSHHEVQFDK